MIKGGVGIRAGGLENFSKINKPGGRLFGAREYAFKARNEGKALIILGDLNVKIGDSMKGNHPKITTGGKT